MKKYLLVFSMMVFLSSLAFGQSEKTSVDFGRAEWVSWDHQEKANFVLGFGAGVFSAFRFVLVRYPSLQDEITEMYDKIAGAPSNTVVMLIDEMYERERYRDLPIIVLIINVKEYVNGYR